MAAMIGASSGFWAPQASADAEPGVGGNYRVDDARVLTRYCGAVSKEQFGVYAH
ncbi:MAG: hypothetical protein ACTHKL_17030 [Streptosporangiaceae bacterium]